MFPVFVIFIKSVQENPLVFSQGDEGLKNISSGTGDYTAGDDIRPSMEGGCQ
jgi:hypothetical protein